MKRMLSSNHSVWVWFICFPILQVLKVCYASAFRRRRHYVFGLSVRPSVRPTPEIPSFDLYIGPLVHPTNGNGFTACPSVCPPVRPSGEVSGHFSNFGIIFTKWNGSNLGFPGIFRRTHGWNGLKFCTLMYLDHLQNWLVCGHSLLIFFNFGAILT